MNEVELEKRQIDYMNFYIDVRIVLKYSGFAK